MTAGDPAPDRRVEHLEADLLEPRAPDRVMAAAVDALGHVDALVCNHARSSEGGLGQLTAAELDACFAVNTRAVLLLAQAFAAQHDGRPGGRVVLFASGQQLGPMAGELAYATDTGYADEAARERVARRFPAGRWGAPDDVARLVAWLCTDDAAWITDQVINSEGGFRRYS